MRRRSDKAVEGGHGNVDGKPTGGRATGQHNCHQDGRSGQLL